LIAVEIRDGTSSAVTANGRFFWLIGLSFLRHLVNAVFGWLIRLIISAYLAER